MDRIIDFTNWERDKEAIYGGSDHKWGIKNEDGRYMIKTSDRIKTDKRNDLNSSYSNSVFSEYICCHIIESLGYDVQETMLGKYTFDSGLTKDVVVCKNFISDDNKYKLIEFKDIENALLDNRPPKVPKIEDIYFILSGNNEYFDKDLSQKSLERYWDVFIIDSLIGNFDRHANNWGYILEKETDKLIDVAPIYDCGSCLFPQLADDSIEYVLSHESEINKRVDMFPTGALIIDGRKVCYKEYINSLQNDDVTNALLRVYPKIDFEKINNIIDNTPIISDIRKEFYKTILKERYDRILTPAYERVKELDIEENKDDIDEEIDNIEL